MDPVLKDLIDAISKIGGLVTVMVAVALAYHQISRSRDQKERELEKRDREIKNQRAQFWLELRKMFAEHDDVHRMLRYGTWPHSLADSASTASSLFSTDIDSSNDREEPTLEQWADLEAYMGLFEHCKAMLDDDLIDFPTFSSIYGYRVGNILANETIEKAKFRNKHARGGWKDFIALAEKLGYKVP